MFQALVLAKVSIIPWGVAPGRRPGPAKPRFARVTCNSAPLSSTGHLMQFARQGGRVGAVCMGLRSPPCATYTCLRKRAVKTGMFRVQWSVFDPSRFAIFFTVRNVPPLSAKMCICIYQKGFLSVESRGNPHIFAPANVYSND